MAANPIEFGPPKLLRLETERSSGEEVVIHCYGKLTSKSAEMFRSKVKEVIPGSKRLILDFEKLDYMDSTGLGSVVSVFVTAKSHGCEIRMVNLSKRVAELMRLTRLVSVFEPFGEH
jgi:anti-anti-sigma factor